MDYRERVSDFDEALRVALDGRQASIWTALPGTVTKVDLVKMVVEVQPTIQAKQAFPDGTVKLVNLPLIPDVPIMFPNGGGYTLTFPVKAGDSCLLHFACRSIDNWWQSGQVSPPLYNQIHDLSDAFATIGPRHQAALVESVHPDNVHLRSDDGLQVIELDRAGGNVNVKANTTVHVTAPNTIITGNLHVTGEVIAGFGGGDQVNLQTHHTSLVQSGVGTSGPPVAGT